MKFKRTVKRSRIFLSARPQHVQEGVHGWRKILTRRRIAYLDCARVSSFRVGFRWQLEQQQTAASDDAQGRHMLFNQQLQELMTKTAKKAVTEIAWASRPRPTQLRKVVVYSTRHLSGRSLFV